MIIDLFTISGVIVALAAIVAVAYMERHRFGCKRFNVPASRHPCCHHDA